VTPVAKNRPVTATLTFQANPDQFLCEGEPILDASGGFTFEGTGFMTEAEQPVDRIACDFAEGWDTSNSATRNVTIPVEGSYVSQPCTRGQTGPLRNCDFAEQADLVTCTPGQPVELRCEVEADNLPQTLRVCERSAALGTGLACTYRDALANVAVADGVVGVSFRCPTARDVNEPGGAYSLFTAPVVAGDTRQAISCTMR
jgi:hypothetical protein